MEVIKYLRDGIAATIRFDYLTRTYYGELSGVPSASLVESSSYEEIQELLVEELDNYLSGGASTEEQWSQVLSLEEARARKNADPQEPAPSADTAGVPEEAEIEAAPIKLRAIEQPVVADYEHRKYLLS